MMKVGWNVYQTTLQGGRRTNNICEGRNHKFNALCCMRHPPFYKVIEYLQKDYAMVKKGLLDSNHERPLTQVVSQSTHTCVH